MIQQQHIETWGLGPLCVALGYISQQQLEACQLLQDQEYTGVALPQILLRCGYITPDELTSVKSLLHAVEDSLPDSNMVPSVACHALVLSHQAQPYLPRVLGDLGVSMTQLACVTRFESYISEGFEQPDMLLAEPDLLAGAALPPDWRSVPVWLLPPLADSSDGLRPGVQLALEQFIRHVCDRIRAERNLALYQGEQEMMATLTRRTVAIRSPQEVLEHLLVSLKSVMGTEAATLFRLDRETHELVFEIVLSNACAMLQGQRLPTTMGLAGWVARSRQPLIMPNVKKDRRFVAAFDTRTGFNTQSILCVPLIALGEVWGVIQLINKTSGGEFTKGDLRLLRTIATLAAFVMMPHATHPGPGDVLPELN